MKEGPLVQMLDRQRVQQAAADEAPGEHPKPFDPNATPIRVIVDVLRHDDSRAVMMLPVICSCRNKK